MNVIADVMTDLIQMPAIIKDGEIQVILPHFLTMDIATIRGMATSMDAEVGYVKMRATYTVSETSMCTVKDCWRPAVGKCDSHP